MVLHEGVITHELDGAVAVHGLVFCGIPLPHADGRLVIDQDAVRFAKV
jgi:hypothetical protein